MAKMFGRALLLLRRGEKGSDVDSGFLVYDSFQTDSPPSPIPISCTEFDTPYEPPLSHPVVANAK